MRYVFYDDFKPGLLKDDSVVDISDVLDVKAYHTPQMIVEKFITEYETLKEELETSLEKPGKPVEEVRLRQPVPKPSLFMCGIGGFGEGEDRKRPINFFIKGWTSIIGPGDTVVLPETKARIFEHEAELAVVFGKEASNVDEEEAIDCIFGYTMMIDVSARGVPYSKGFWPQKSFDTFGPLGPVLVTMDEIPDPYNLQVKLLVDDILRQDYNTDDMSHTLGEKISKLSGVCTLSPGDIMACGTNHHGLGPMQDGETVTIEIENIGRMSVEVKDPYKREWNIEENVRP
ncbi:fumarylacetoacetate hydrolase [Candidatus Bathyarchaeota archaeon]|nr:fumarylacetoacetate hydrolase [Candidatus Bathyarchaeota archaeon]